MATRDSMIRSINRSLQQHYETFGEYSAEYQTQLAMLTGTLGITPLRKSGGAAYFSRSGAVKYDLTKLSAAHEKTKGTRKEGGKIVPTGNTAAQKAQKYINKLVKMGISPTKKNIRKLARITTQADAIQGNVYAIMKEMARTEEQKADISRAMYDYNTAKDGTKGNPLALLMKYAKSGVIDSNGDLLDAIDEIIQNAQEKEKEKASKKAVQAARTKRGKIKL